MVAATSALAGHVSDRDICAYVDSPASMPACNALYREAAAFSSTWTPRADPGDSCVRVRRSSSGTSAICCAVSVLIQNKLGLCPQEVVVIRQAELADSMSEPEDLCSAIR